jgi:hypothetical protein
MSDGNLSCGCCCNKSEEEFKKICSTKQFNEVIEFFNL